jgi:hypothetical protein
VSVVQALLSLQFIGVKTQPVAGLQVSVVQALLSLQVIVTWVHALFEHPSVVQALLSLHDAGIVAVFEHVWVVKLHTSVVQILLSLQLASEVH